MKTRIHFGTSGWRAVIADEFTFANVCRVSQAIAKYVQEHRLHKKGIIVAYDTRFLSSEFAQAAAQTIAAAGIKVFLTVRDTPTPVIAYQILNKKTAGAVNITASHNPPTYNGIKFSPAYGGPAPIQITREIESNIDHNPILASRVREKIHLFDPRPAYLKRMRQLVNFPAIRQAKLKIGVDVLYGTGRDYLDQLLQEAGCQLTVLHKKLNPLFGGLPPEPAKAQLEELTSIVKHKRLHLGLAVDGDADRFGVIDSDGKYISANQVFSLLTHHLILTRPRQKKIARTLSTTHMVDALAQRAGLQVVETAVGFKYIGEQLAKGDCLIGGEESGGLSIVRHIPEKDGILACLLIAELVAVRKVSLGTILKRLYQEVGPFFSGREDFHLGEAERPQVIRRMKSLSQKASLYIRGQKTAPFRVRMNNGRSVFRSEKPRALDRGASLNKRILRFDQRDGYKFVFVDGSWLMLRISGTESVVRCYCEASTKAKLKELQRIGQKLIKESSE